MKNIWISRFLMVFIISILMEMIVFNHNFVIRSLQNKNINQLVANETITFHEFEKDGDVLRTKEDSQIVLNSIPKLANEVLVKFNSSEQIEFLVLYYILGQEQEYTDNKSIAITDVSQYNYFQIPQNVSLIRIDFGERSGITISDLQLIINPTEFDFSTSRVVAINLLYWGAFVLFSLQKSPDYSSYFNKIQKEESEDL